MSRTLKRVSRGSRAQLEKANPPRKTLAEVFPMSEPPALDVDLAELFPRAEPPALDVDPARLSLPGFDEPEGEP